MLEVFGPSDARVRALMLGVGAPDPVTANHLDGEREKSFAVLTTIDHEFRWFRDRLKERIPRDDLAVRIFTDAVDTTSAKILAHLREAVSSRPAPDVLIVYLSGHGIQFAELEPGGAAIRCEDRYREAFVASRGGYVRDSDISAMWGRVAESTALVVLADTCNAHGVIRMVDVVELALGIEIGPWPVQLQLSASRAGQDAPQLDDGGIIHEAMKQAFAADGLVSDYQSLYDHMARHCAREWNQVICGLFRGPDNSFLLRAPFR